LVKRVIGVRDKERVEECRWQRRLVGIDKAARKVADRLAVKVGNDRMLGPAFFDNRRPMTMATLRGGEMRAHPAEMRLTAW
jgi:hypothetical protein